MCGISGIIDTKNLRVEKDIIQKMNGIIEHRGPDGDGFYFDDHLALGHRRLSIIDLSDAGKQPMEYSNGSLVLTFNGEIYNYIEVREELKKLGYKFVSSSDSEVILAAYSEWGDKCVSKFNGMWAFAIYDKLKKRMFMSRDRFGVKPLYYSNFMGKFFFGSEIKQLLAVGIPPKVNEYMLLQKMVCHLESHTDETLFDKVFTLLPSHNLIYDLQTFQFTTERYYSIKKRPEVEGLNLVDATKYLGEVFQNAVNLRLRSDVTVGTCLSGGLDSSAVSLYASKIYHSEASEKFKAVNAKSTEKARDESHYAEVVSKHLNLDLFVVEPQYADFKKNMDEVIWSQEEPFGSPSMFMGYEVFKKARKENCIVMLNGQGGDEILLGYERYFVAALKNKSLLKKVKESYKYYKNSRLSLLHTLAFHFYFGSAVFRKAKLVNSSFVKREFIKRTDFKHVIEIVESGIDIFAMQVNEITKTQLPKLLRYEDRNSMANSIETRLPFLDYNVVETALSINVDHKIHNGWSKFILRKLIDKDLPEEITWRRQKLGFESPENQWLKMHDQSMKGEIAESSLLHTYCDVPLLIKKFGGLSNWDKWLYYNVARWEKVFNVIH